VSYFENWDAVIDAVKKAVIVITQTAQWLDLVAAAQHLT